MINDLLLGLNQKQRDAVCHVNGPMLVTAGAGSGKTRVLTRRIANLVKYHHVNPDSIVALTFTVKATDEMRDRIKQLLGSQANYIHIYTFNAMGRYIIRREAPIDNMGDFTPIDDNTRTELIRELIAEVEGISIHHVTLNQAEKVGSDISRAKANLEQPSAHHVCARMQSGMLEFKVYDRYYHALLKHHEMDMDDDIMMAVFLLYTKPSVLSYYQNRFHYINVDEYQDTNKAQYELIRFLDGKANNLFAVGDENQSIYGWRGANIHNILDFKKDYPAAQVIHMRDNYRSTGNIIGVANSIIKHNYNDPNYIANKPVKSNGKKVIKCTATKTDTQAEYVVQRIIKDHKRYKLNYNDFAVLFRRNKQAKLVESMILKHHLHYHLVSQDSFFNLTSVQDILSYLYIINNLKRDSQSLRRIINKPKRGITDKNYIRLINYTDSTRHTLPYVINNIYLVKGISKRGQHAILNFYLQVQKWRRHCRGSVSLVSVIKQILKDTGYLKDLEMKLKKTHKLIDRAKIQANIDGIKGIIKIARKLNKRHKDDSVRKRVVLLAHFISINSLPKYTMNTGNKSMINLMSIHASKGLEFPVVFLIGMNQGIFPSKKSKTLAEEHEERRIAYVGITRAENKLYLLSTQYSFSGGSFKRRYPSIFLSEADSKYMKSVHVKMNDGKIQIQ